MGSRVLTQQEKTLCSIHKQANSPAQINKYSKAFTAGASTPGGPAVPIERRRGISEEMGFSLLFVLRAVLVFHSGQT